MTPQCQDNRVVTQLLRVSGSTDLQAVYSTTVDYPFMQVRFYSDGSTTGEGFIAKWSLPERMCQGCPTNRISPAGSTSLAACVCNAGLIDDNGGTCLQDCNANHYFVDPVCVPCPANSSSPTGRTALAACLCSAGSSGPDGGTCTPCLAGKYKAATGSSLCQDCLTDSPSPAGSPACICNAGSEGVHGGICTLCSGGKYKSGRGPSICEDCPTNSLSPAGSTALTACVCNAGSSGSDGGTCTPCLADTYISNTSVT